jgi:hypothetical protein
MAADHHNRNAHHPNGPRYHHQPRTFYSWRGGVEDVTANLSALSGDEPPSPFLTADRRSSNKHQRAQAAARNQHRAFVAEWLSPVVGRDLAADGGGGDAAAMASRPSTGLNDEKPAAARRRTVPFPVDGIGSCELRWVSL